MAINICNTEKRILNLVEVDIAIVGAGGAGLRAAILRDEMTQSMETGCGIYRLGEERQATCDTIANLKERYCYLRLDDRSRAWNTEWLAAIELGYQLDIAEAIAHSAINRRESRGAHQRLDGFNDRDDASFLKHTLAHYQPNGPPRIDYGPVTITRSPPGRRAYGAEAEHIEQIGGEASHAV